MRIPIHSRKLSEIAILAAAGIAASAFTPLLPLAFAQATGGQTARIALPSLVQVHSGVVTLDDLLSPAVPSAIRERAKQILLGNAPAAGSHRTFSHDEIARAVRNDADLAARILIPAAVTVDRWSRLLTRGEVALAIEKSISANQVTGDAAISPEDIAFATPVVVTEDAPALAVMHYDQHEDLGRTRVALWTVSESGTPPFWVTVNRNLAFATSSSAAPARANAMTTAKAPMIGRPGDAGGVPAHPPSTPSTIAPSDRQPISAQNALLLVHAGKSVQLIVQGSGMRITTRATALEAGREGQQVRVQCEPGGKVLLAKVMNAGTAEIDY